MMKPVFQLDLDLPRTGVGPAEGSAIVQQKPAVGQIERGPRDRQIIRYRLAIVKSKVACPGKCAGMSLEPAVNPEP